MSVFYCHECNKLIDSDFDGINVVKLGEPLKEIEICDNCLEDLNGH